MAEGGSERAGSSRITGLQEENDSLYHYLISYDAAYTRPSHRLLLRTSRVLLQRNIRDLVGTVRCI